MTSPRVAALVLLVATLVLSLAAVDKRVDRDLARPTDTYESQVIVAERRAAKTTTRRVVYTTLIGRPWRQLYRYHINRRIAATQLKLRAAIALEPDDFDGREALWMLLHRLQTRRDKLA